MKQIEFKDIEYRKKYITTELFRGSWFPVIVIKYIDEHGCIAFKEAGNQNPISINKLNVSKIGNTNYETIFALNYFKTVADAIRWCRFENSLL